MYRCVCVYRVNGGVSWCLRVGATTLRITTFIIIDLIVSLTIMTLIAQSVMLCLTLSIVMLGAVRFIVIVVSVVAPVRHLLFFQLN